MADRDELTNHNYDGIQEYDNDLPRWWVVLFAITIAWGVVYAIWFHLPSTPTPHERLAQDLADLKTLSAAKSSGQQAGSEEDLLKLAADSSTLAKGGAIYAGKCAVCHGPAGQGMVGPNLTDDYWIHGGKITDIRNTVIEGVPAKGMISWKALLTSDETNSVVAFIWSIHGTNPPNPKAPQGDLVAR